MKGLKIFGLAALAAMSLIGASSASGDVLCQNSGPEPCSAPYANGTVLTGGLKAGTNAVLTASNGLTVTCTASSVTYKMTGNNANPVAGSITAATWTSCKNQLGQTCEATARNLAWSASLSWTSGGNGTMAVSSGGTGNPSAKIVCGTTECVYGTTSATLSLTGGNPAEIVANKVSLTREVGTELACGKTATWSATYVLTGTNTAAWLLNS